MSATERAGTAQVLSRRPDRRTFWRDVLRGLGANRLALVGAVAIALLLGVALLALVIAPYPYDQANYDAISQPPSWRFPFGTDLNGRDMYSRVIYGARVSLLVGIGSQALALLIGLPIGALAGFAGGRLDNLLMRLVDVMYAFPQLLLVILLMTLFGRGVLNIVLAIGLVSWVTVARLIRAELLSLRRADFVLAARATGAGRWRLVVRHLLPNALSPVIVALTLGIPEAIFVEAGLSFIGVGINPPRPSWGQMVGEYFGYLQSAWYLATIPALAIALTMMAFTFFGDGLRDALDPRTGTGRYEP